MDGAVQLLLAAAGDAAERAVALAGRANAVAEGTRAVASRVQGCEATPWRSVAAEAFRAQVAELVVVLRLAADDVERAGDLIRVHAATASARADHLAALAGALDRALDRAVAGEVDDAVDRAAEALERALPGPLRVP